jgi:hypothetical protein
VSVRELLAELKRQIVLQGRSRALSEAGGNENGADFCVTLCVTRADKIGRFLITWDDRNNYSTRLKAVICSLLMTSDDSSKNAILPYETSFDPLNYGVQTLQRGGQMPNR